MCDFKGQKIINRKHLLIHRAYFDTEDASAIFNGSKENNLSSEFFDYWF